ncbi:hypothetical protein HPB47_001889 [Ixodes persulcatus]|uniref:Uncharacterized protein n=1 Tax=Ixodes persulcatus TaxID=34615 RepID=A0AC60PMS0_IXOPE|nr:hypothetical protein HPB47_001889 [Ixodes persulcatus]
MELRQICSTGKIMARDPKSPGLDEIDHWKAVEFSFSSSTWMAYAIVEFLHLEQVDVMPALWIQGEHSTYEQARKKLERNQYTSELSSDSERSQGKRKRRTPPQWSQSDEEPVRHKPTKAAPEKCPQYRQIFLKVIC